MHEPALGQRQSTVPGDRELARSSPAFMVVNWIVKDGEMRGVKERGEKRRRSYEGRRKETKREKPRIVCLCFPCLALLGHLGLNSPVKKKRKKKITIEHRLISFYLFTKVITTRYYTTRKQKPSQPEATKSPTRSHPHPTSAPSYHQSHPTHARTHPYPYSRQTYHGRPGTSPPFPDSPTARRTIVWREIVK